MLEINSGILFFLDDVCLIVSSYNITPPIQSFLDTALNIAVSKIPKSGGNLQPFIDTAKVLLEAGADVHFSKQWGDWNHVR